MKRSALLCLALALTFHVSSASAATQYNLTRLGAFGAYPVSGSASSYAYAVNDLGSVAGHVASGGQGIQAFFWKNNVMTGLGMLGGPCTTAGCSSFAYGINDSDVVVGSSATPLGASPFGDMAFRWNPATGMTGLGWLAPAFGCNVATARGINNNGLIAGFEAIYTANACAVASVHSDAFLYFNSSMYYSLTGIEKGTNIYTEARAINNSGAIAGRSGNPYNAAQNGAFVWTSGGSITWLGDLGSPSGSGHTSYAYGINDTREVVGMSTSPRTNGYEAYLWSPGAGMAALGDLPGGLFDSRAYGINNSRQVVGAGFSSFGPEAFIWDGVNGMVSLNTLLLGAPGWWLVEARDINNHGQIVGWGLNPSGGTEAFLLTPAPVNAPAIAFSPASFAFTAGVGANPASKTLSISNAQTGTLNWTVSPGANWLSLSPTSGSQSGTVTLSVNVAGLAVGTTYATNVSITGNAANSPQSVPVTLTIVSSPTIGFTPASFSWTIVEGSTSSAKQQLRITNNGGGTMFYSTSGEQPWILAPSSGALASGAYSLVDVSVNPSGMIPGNLSGNVVITANGASNTPQRVPVSLTILPAITITYPNGNEVLRSGSTVVITWNVTPPGQTVAKTDTYYTTNGGASWTLIKSQKGMKTNCSWRVPSVKNQTESRVWTKFLNAAGNVIASDESDTTFQIIK